MPFTFILLKHGNSCCYQSRTVITYGVPKDNSATAWQEYNMVSLYIDPSGCHLHLGLIKRIIDTRHFVHYEAREDNHLLLCLNAPMCLSQSCTVVLLCANVIYAVIIIKVIVDMVKSTHMPILGMNALNGFVQFAHTKMG